MSENEKPEEPAEDHQSKPMSARQKSRRCRRRSSTAATRNQQQRVLTVVYNWLLRLFDFAQRLHMDVSLRHPEWISLYYSHHRAVSAFRQGRCFLAGDAAHIHSPVGAQGMNTGLQDAYNLAWKLALVSQGKARAALLDTYHEERAPIAHTLGVVKE